MRILLTRNYLPDAQQSMLRFSQTLERELRNAGHEVHVLRPRARLGRNRATGQGPGKWLAYIDKFVLFIPQLRRFASRADVVHICDHAYSPYTRYLAGIPTVVTCHDLLSVSCAFGEFSGRTVRWSGRKYQQLILTGIGRASLVGCDSASTRSDLLRLTKVSRERVSVIHIGYNFAYSPCSDSEARQRVKRLGIDLDARFIIHVGSDVWYKNVTGVVRIFSSLLSFPQTNDLHLVMVGNGRTRELNSLIGEYGLSSRIIVLSRVSNDDLRALYSRASGLLFPSLCEGFGWPIIEAQACGCPVFTSNRAPMTEVAGDGAVYFDPEKYQEAADIIRRHLPESAEMRSLGFVNAARFSATAMAAAYVRLYFQAIGVTRGLCSGSQERLSASASDGVRAGNVPFPPG